MQRDETAPPKALIRAGVLPTLLRSGETRPLELQKEDKADKRRALQENKGTQDKKSGDWTEYQGELGKTSKGRPWNSEMHGDKSQCPAQPVCEIRYGNSPKLVGS